MKVTTQSRRVQTHSNTPSPQLSDAIWKFRTSLLRYGATITNPAQNKSRATKTLRINLHELDIMFQKTEHRYKVQAVDQERQDVPEQFVSLKMHVTDIVSDLDNFSDSMKMARALVALRRCGMDAWELEGKHITTRNSF